MCGIVGIFAYHNSAPPVEAAEAVKIREAMRPRGPDGAGLWLSPDKRLALAHRRLSIIDLSEAGIQPMATPDQSIRVVFNGEIYNYRELRNGLEHQGHRFQSQSDTEVLLHLYQEYGAAMMDRLRGMYAFAIWDNLRQSLLLSRDPFGIKPLYYSDDGKTLRFASQVKALLAGGAVDTSPQAAGHAGFFLWGYVPEPYTLFQGVRALPAGSTLLQDLQGNAVTKGFCAIPAELARAYEAGKGSGLDKEAVHDELRLALADSIKHHLVADVPVGVFLSSGLDSSTITALAAQEQGRLHSITLGFQELRGSAHDETAYAAKIAARYGTVHQTRWITREDFAGDYHRILEAMDQPAVDGVNMYFVAKIAAAAGMKTALSGLGGDELFGGYPSFRDIPRMARTFSRARSFPGLGRMCRLVAAPVLKRFTSPKYAGLLEYGGSYAGAYLLRRGLFMPWELPEVMDPDMARAGWQALQPLVCLEETIPHPAEDFLTVSALEMVWYMRNQLLRVADWAGMAHSLEIRVPLVDIMLLRQVVPLLASKHRPTKLDMAGTLATPLPAEVLNRPKSGFLVPVQRWLAAASGQGGGRGDHDWRIWAQTVYQHHTAAL
ncbi:MAG: asparagine synthase (glutamine-hydrolyzing) [Deltaproteobacteria bacterium]|nr:asparagine synthase (glutamine-hydrolyzing) [Deltaproteobacteria bacterium]